MSEHATEAEKRVIRYETDAYSVYTKGSYNKAPKPNYGPFARDMAGDNRGAALKGSSDTFYINDWTGYPDAPKPEGPFRILEGEEYSMARKAANNANAKIHKNRPDLKGIQIHEMKPVKFGGSPIDIDNKIALTPKEHAKYTSFWNKILRERKKK